jgi:hypothetical protein
LGRLRLPAISDKVYGQSPAGSCDLNFGADPKQTAMEDG